MEAIVTQTIPAAVINNPQVDWNPYANEVKPAAAKDSDFSPGERSRRQCTGAEYTLRCAGWEPIGARKLADPYSPNAPTLIARRFNEDRRLPEERVRKMFEQMLSSPMAAQVAALIQKRLGRPLEPFDIWYNGFKPKLKYTQEELDSIVREKISHRRMPMKKTFPYCSRSWAFLPSARNLWPTTSSWTPPAVPATRWAPRCTRQRRTCGHVWKRTG